VKLRALAPAKVNLCLWLGPVRDDGRHQLVTVFESVSLADEVSLRTLDDGADEVVCPGVRGPNLATAALRALRGRGWAGPPVGVEIRKRIPVAGGMGGGSADAAAVLRLATELAPGRPEEIAGIAASLGADVPSQLAPGVVLGTGAGDEVEPLLALAPHALVVVPAEAALATADVYREADRLGLPRERSQLQSLYELVAAAYRDGARPPRELLVNDLEPAAISLRPRIADALAALDRAGAEPALVCGSGATVAGIFWEPDRAAAAVAELAPRFPLAQALAPVDVEFAAVTVE
jgi:4-diphosphocytidyl-2-C-methyl-D-erythritol kinase